MASAGSPRGLKDLRHNNTEQENKNTLFFSMNKGIDLSNMSCVLWPPRVYEGKHLCLLYHVYTETVKKYGLKSNKQLYARIDFISGSV